jgi:hypothetical protein
MTRSDFDFDVVSGPSMPPPKPAPIPPAGAQPAAPRTR